ncbi:LPXTG cell wall anchor domain-containing protein [Mycetocola tolaasinivorans]|uniref:LPXTG cell wall anchor domain-containing protein n=1 Tax=Mycetocola tolaasinivorans TaxID=76635 RepID=A0A3L7AA75_9MICO|nr:LPXTG cell wall anchor domain-containing protein [Mycetocola tolaasinivorans]
MGGNGGTAKLGAAGGGGAGGKSLSRLSGSTTELAPAGASGSVTVTYVVTDPTTLTATSTSPSTITAGTPLIVNALVSNRVSGGKTPVGAVALTVGNTVVETVNVDDAGTATLRYGGTVVGALKYSLRFVPAHAGFGASTIAERTVTVQASPTTTTLSVDRASAPIRTPRTLSATVAAEAPSEGVPTGQVRFADGSGVIGTADLVDGVATLDQTLNEVELRAYTATYLPPSSPNYVGSVSGPIAVRAYRPTSAVTVTFPATSTVVGQPVDATIAVTSPDGTPSGSVVLTVDGTALPAATLNDDGIATVALPASALTSARTISVSAAYNGTPVIQESGSGRVTHTITAAQVALNVEVLTSQPSHGDTVSLQATAQVVTPGQATPTGIVTFYADGNRIGSGPLALEGGVPTVRIQSTPLNGGDREITASFAGSDTVAAGGTAEAVELHVSALASVTTLTAQQTGAEWGTPLAFTATVRAAAPPVVPTLAAARTLFSVLGPEVIGGSVQLYVDGQPDGDPVALRYGSSTLESSLLALGDHEVSARYIGTDAFATSDSLEHTQSVTAATSTLVLGISNARPYLGGSSTITATVTGAGSDVEPLGGAVTFSLGGPLVSIPLDADGVARIAVPTQTLGQGSISATYAGDAFRTGAGPTSVNFEVIEVPSTAMPTSTATPTDETSEVPTSQPTDESSEVPTSQPTDESSEVPTSQPTDESSEVPTVTPTDESSEVPTSQPTDEGSEVPTVTPTDGSSEVPTKVPSDEPSVEPTGTPVSPSPEASTTAPGTTTAEASASGAPVSEAPGTGTPTTSATPVAGGDLPHTGSSGIAALTVGGILMLLLGGLAMRARGRRDVSEIG